MSLQTAIQVLIIVRGTLLVGELVTRYGCGRRHSRRAVVEKNLKFGARRKGNRLNMGIMGTMETGSYEGVC
jgi:hypothetical protein